MKRFTLFLIVAILALTSCATRVTGWEGAPSTKLDVSLYKDSLVPVTLDAVKLAQETNSIHFWFMAGNGNKWAYWGDATLVVFPNGKTMLVDSGNKDYAPILALNLERLGIHHIDYFFLSHPHGDHANGFISGDTILHYFTVGHVYTEGTVNQAWASNRLVDFCKPKKIGVTILHAGDVFELEGVKFTVLNPTADRDGEVNSSDSGVNDTSLVFRMDYGDFSALFPGDIYTPREGKLIKDFGELLDVDLLKIPHHGHDTSNSKAFGDATSPKLAVAMGCIPLEPSLYANYSRTGSAVYMDLIDGYVHAWSDGTDLKWETFMERLLKKYDLYNYGSPYLV